MAKGLLTLKCQDVYGTPLDDDCMVLLQHTVLQSASKTIKKTSVKKGIVTSLSAANGGRYGVQIFPMKYRPVSRFITIEEGVDLHEIVVFPVDPRKIHKIDFPRFDVLSPNLQQILGRTDQLEGFEGVSGNALYQALDNVKKAGLLNIACKMNGIVFANGQAALSYVTSLRRIRGDRVFANVEKSLRDVTIDSISTDLFQSAPAGAHTPPPGFTLKDSFKTFENYGNLQLTFSVNQQNLDHIVDVDIDDAQGIGHVFQVLRNVLTNGETNPYDIHQILLGYQRLDPGYHLRV